MEALLHQVAEIQELVRRLNNIREAEELACSKQFAVDPQSNSPQAHTQKGGRPITEKNGSFQQQGPARGRDFPQILRCSCRSTPLLCGLKRKDLSGQRRCWP